MGLLEDEFALDAEQIFQEAEVGTEVTYTPHGGAPVTVLGVCSARAIDHTRGPRQAGGADRTFGGADGRVQAERVEVLLRVADAPSPGTWDSFEIDGKTYVLDTSDTEPVRHLRVAVAFRLVAHVPH